MKHAIRQIISILTAFSLLFAVSGHQLLYHICHHHGVHNVTFSFFAHETIEHCTCFGCHHHDELCTEERHECHATHHDNDESCGFQEEESCCDIISKILKINNPFQIKEKNLLPAVLTFVVEKPTPQIEIAAPIFGQQILRSELLWRSFHRLKKPFLFTQFLF